MIELHAHRGIPKIYPENTLEGFEHAIRLGAKILEVDVVVSKNGELVISHDPFMRADLCKTPSGQLIKNEKEHNIYHLSIQEISAYDVGSIPSKEFPNQIKKRFSKPTFKDLSNLLKAYPQVSLNVEVKSEQSFYGVFQPFPAEYAQLVLEEMSGFNNLHMIQSFDAVFLNEFYQLRDDITMGFLISDQIDLKLALAQLNFKPSYLNPHFDILTSDSLDYLKSECIRVVPWTVNELVKAKELVEMGVDGLITDKIDEFLKFFG